MVDHLPRFELAKRESVSIEVARGLIDYLLSGDFAPGSRLPSERQLAESVGVGRSVVREALKSLGLLGLVEFRQGGGTYLRGLDSDLLPQVIEWGLMLGERKVIDLIEVRKHIEVVLAELAALRRDDDDIMRIEQMLSRMHGSLNVDEFVEADVRFHQAIAAASKNSVLVSLHSSIGSLLRVWIRRVVAAEPSTTFSFQEHVPIFEAIQAGEHVAAREAMRAHMHSATRRLEDILAELQPRLDISEATADES